MKLTCRKCGESNEIINLSESVSCDKCGNEMIKMSGDAKITTSNGEVKIST